MCYSPYGNAPVNANMKFYHTATKVPQVIPMAPPGKNTIHKTSTLKNIIEKETFERAPEAPQRVQVLPQGPPKVPTGSKHGTKSKKKSTKKGHNIYYTFIHTRHLKKGAPSQKSACEVPARSPLTKLLDAMTNFRKSHYEVPSTKSPR